MSRPSPAFLRLPLLAVLWWFAATSAPAAEGWVSAAKARSPEDISLWTRTIPGAELKAFRGATHVRAAMPNAVSMLNSTEAMCRYVFRCKHAELLGVGARAMADQGVAWVLSRMSAEASRRSEWGRPIMVRTWPAGIDRLFALRFYELSDQDGVFARAASSWIVLDIAAKRPRRPDAFVAGLPRNEELPTLEGGAAALSPAEGLEPIAERIVSYSDIDRNGHANNARYAQWIQDALDPAPLVAAKGFRLDINYLAEALPGASVRLFAGPEAATGDGSLTRLVEGRIGEAPCFRARLTLRG